MHVTPGVGFERGPLGPMIADGALVDRKGVRLWDLDPVFVRAALGLALRLAPFRE